jgi:hypothetical protein
MIVRAGDGMAKIERSEDIQAWQKSRTPVNAMYDVTGKKFNLN